MYDDLQDTVEVSQNISVPEPAHAIAVLSEDRRSPCILEYSFRMLATIQLNDKICVAAGEVGNERSDRMLPNELEPLQLPIAEARPEFALRVRRG